jgi:hypothetical protein
MDMSPPNRRRFLRATGAGLGRGLRGPLGLTEPDALAQERGARPPRVPAGVSVVNPRDRVPVSLIIDDSTCLVNLAHFAIHPEMVNHTWAIDTRSGRPRPERTARSMENWGWSVGKSADQLGEYLSYALKILKNVGVTCEGITTPGGFGYRALPELARGALQACRDVFQAEVKRAPSARRLPRIRWGVTSVVR